ncbi:MAG: preprotein translocase subunit SecE [Thermoleophilaceae bacterium]|nr:preprotein translocase subunit SecE [Thermoleophilaceae bacterium]
MASKSNRQKAKERQARRRAEHGGGVSPEGVEPDPAASQPEPAASQPAEPSSVEPEPDPAQEPAVPPQPDHNRRDDLLEEAQLEVGAPPADVGHVQVGPEDAPDVEDDPEHFDPAEDHPEEDAPATTGPRGHRGEGAGEHADRPRFVQFLFAVRAELARVQWPDRQTLVTLTGVVLGFVLVAGGYLGLLDAIFSRFIQAIL